MVRRALLIADLEGVAGVDSTFSLALGGPGHAQACEWMTDEVNACVEGLLAQGYEQVRVSDTHRSGSNRANLVAARLHSACELVYVDPDYYGGALLDQVSAVACVGMHAAAETGGFAAHTVGVHTAFLWAGRALSETEIAFFLAAERGVPSLFSAGDDVLARQVGASCVVTKQAISPHEAKSLPRGEVLEKLRRAAARAPEHLEVPRAPSLLLRFKRQVLADAAERAGAHRSGRLEVQVPGDGFTQCFEHALALVEATGPLLAGELTGPPGTEAFARDAARLLAEPFADHAR